MVAGWYFGKHLGVLVALLTGLSWAYAESVARPANIAAALWNRSTRIAVLVAFTYLIDLVHRNQEELRRLLAQRDDFLSLVAHELRAPVAAIEIVATGLARTRAVGDAEKRALDQMREQARGLTALAEGLLSVGRLEAHPPTATEREPIDLRPLVLSLAETTPRARVSAPMDPVMVAADSEVIRRALHNVTENALKFSDEEQPIEIDLATDGAEARIRVIDHGIGLDPAAVEGLFRKYGRLPAARSFTGIGLGLYYARMALRAHGGEIVARSDGPGQGATFELRLPVTKAVATEPAARG